VLLVSFLLDLLDGPALARDRFGVDAFIEEELRAASKRFPKFRLVIGVLNHPEQSHLGRTHGRGLRNETNGVFRRCMAVTANKNLHSFCPVMRV